MNNENKRVEIHISKFWAQLRNHPLVWDTCTTTLWSILGKAVGFLIPFFIAAWFGVSSETDAFFFAYGLIIFLATIFSTVVESIIVPFIAEARSRHEDVGIFVGRILGMSVTGLALISTVFLVIIKPILSVLTKFSPEGLDLVYWILLESVPLIVLLVWTSILSGALNAYKVFNIPAISPAFRALITLAFIFVFKGSMGVHAIAWGYVTGELFRLLVLFAMLKKLNLFHLKFSVSWETKFAEFFKTSSYQIIGMSFLAFTPLVNKTMASWLGAGNVSLLEYADRLYMIPTTLLSSGLIVTLLSHWSEQYQMGGEVQLANGVSKVVKVVWVIGIILTVFLFTGKGYLVKLVYGHGQFPKEKLLDVEHIFGFYLLGIVPYFLSQVYVRAFLVKKNTSALLFTALLMVFGGVLFNLIFMHVMGVAGIALATAVVMVAAFIFLHFLFTRKVF